MPEARGPIGSHRSFLFILLVSIFTCGIYTIYWYYKTSDELKEYAKLEYSPVIRVLMLVFGGVLLFIPTLYAVYAWLSDISRQAEKEGVSGFSPILHLVCSMFIPFWSFYMIYRVQATLNNIWDKASGATAASYAPVEEAKVIRAVEQEAEEEAEGDEGEKPRKSKKPKEEEKVFIRCPRCKSKNRENANYCVKCGKDLQE